MNLRLFIIIMNTSVRFEKEIKGKFASNIITSWSRKIKGTNHTITMTMRNP